MRFATPVRPSVSDALRAVEEVLLRGGQRTARRNAWTAVVEDRRRAEARTEAERILAAAAGARQEPLTAPEGVLRP